MNLKDVYESGRVERFHTVADYSGGARQSNAEHQWGVALIASELAGRRNYEGSAAMLMFAALTHDSEEATLGDFPATAKWRFPRLAAAYTAAEDVVRGELDLHGQLDEEGRNILKWADSLELFAHCVRKTKAGNGAYLAVVDNIAAHMMRELPQWREARDLMGELS